MNSISPLADGTVWVVLHNENSPSFAALIDLKEGKVIRKVENIGHHVHSWLEYPRGDPSKRLFLSSKEGTLVYYDLKTNQRRVLFTVIGDDETTFLKGLTVVEDVAYFGASPFRGRLGRASVECSLYAFDLITRKLLFTRAALGSIGLINSITLLGSEDSTHRAQITVNVLQAAAATARQQLSSDKSCANFKSASWAATRARNAGFAFGNFFNGADITQLPIRFTNVDDMENDVLALSKAHGWTIRKDVNNYFILLVTMNGVTDDQSNFGPFFEVQDRLQTSAFIRSAICALGFPIGRSRLMMLKPGEQVKEHVDRTSHVRKSNGNFIRDPVSGYWGRRFRVHIPIITTPGILFKVGNSQINMERGGVYVFDNSKSHSVENLSNEMRVHLVIDTVGSPEFFKALEHSQTWPRTNDESFTLNHVKLDAYNEQARFVLFERWVDSAVFDTMPESIVRGYLINHVLKDLVREQDFVVVEAALEMFLSIWKLAPVGLNIENDLLERCFCVKGVDGKGVILKNGFSLYQAVEPLSRMLMYKCRGEFTNESRAVERGQGPDCSISGSTTRKM